MPIVQFYSITIVLVITAICFPVSLSGQSWEFAKEKDGVKLYTRKEPGKTIRGYKGVATIMAPADKVLSLVENANNTSWWDKNVTVIKVLLYEKMKRARFYMVYDLPWPVTDRDLCVEATVEVYPGGGGSVTTLPLPGCAPESSDYIRIRQYRQKWTILPAQGNSATITLEGYVDPAGSIPDWLSNMIVVDSPLKVINTVRSTLEKN